MNVALVFASCLAPAFVFPGGTDAQLAESLSKQVKQPVAIIGDGQKVKAFEVRTNLEAKDFARLVRTRSGMEKGNEKVWGLSRPGWPNGFYKNSHPQLRCSRNCRKGSFSLKVRRIE